MRLDVITDERFHQDFLGHELDIIQNINHSNVAKVFEILTIGESVVIIGELYECDLLQYVQQRGCIVERVAKRLLLELTNAVKYLHDLGIGNSVSDVR